MPYLRILCISAVVAALGAAVGCASTAQPSANGQLPATSFGQAGAPTAGWIHAGSLVYHVPHYFATRSAAPAVRPAVTFSYYGGPVLVTPKLYVIQWGYKTYGDPDSVSKLLRGYLTNMGGSAHNNIYTQYYETSGSQKYYVTNPTGELGGIWNDSKHSIPVHPTDQQVAQEAIYGVEHFGYDADASYVVATAHDHSTQGFATQWCAYHSAVYYGSDIVSYTNLPYMPDAGANCGANFITAPNDETGTDEGVTIVEGHEEGESVTDPIPGYGWYNFYYGEIGDICAWQGIANETFGKKSYTMQPMFSNASQSCVQTYQ